MLSSVNHFQQESLPPGGTQRIHRPIFGVGGCGPFRDQEAACAQMSLSWYPTRDVWCIYGCCFFPSPRQLDRKCRYGCRRAPPWCKDPKKQSALRNRRRLHSSDQGSVRLNVNLEQSPCRFSESGLLVVFPSQVLVSRALRELWASKRFGSLSNVSGTVSLEGK